MTHSSTLVKQRYRSRNRRAVLTLVGLLAGIPFISEASAQDGAAASSPNERVTRRIPDDLNFANGLYRDRRYDLAAEEYEKFLKTAPPGVDADEARYGLANALLFLGKYKDARLAFERFLENAPKHLNAPTALYRVGETAYLLGDLPAARVALERFTSGNAGHRHLETAWSHLGDLYLRTGELGKAKSAYQTVLKTATGSLAHRSRLGLGRVLSSLGETDAALAILAELVKSGGPEWVDKAWFETGRIETSVNRHEKAIDAFVSLEKAAPKSLLVPESRLLRADALSRLGRHEDAEALLKPLASSPSANIAAPAIDALGVSFLSRGANEQALVQFEEGLAKYAKSGTAPLLAYHAAETEQRLGKISQARTRFLQLAESYPTDPLAESAILRTATLALEGRDLESARQLASSFPTQFPKSPLIADSRLIEARIALAESNPKAAIQILDDSLANLTPGPSTSQAIRYYLGLAYRADGQAAKSAEVLKALANTSAAPAAVDAQFLLGQGYIEAGKFSEAIPSLEAYLERKPKGEVADFALAHLAHAQLELGRADAASKTLDQLATRFPKSKALATTRLRLAEGLLATKQFDRAAGLFTLASETEDVSTRARALSGLGWARLQGGKAEEAAATFARLLEVAPEDPLAPDAAFARGRALERAKQTEPALAAYSLAAGKYAKSEIAGQALLAQGRLLVELKRSNDAAEIFEKIAKDYPTKSGEALDVVLSEWGWALVDASKADASDRVFNRLLSEFPASSHAADARFNLAETAFAARKFEPIAAWLTPIVTPGSKAPATLIQSSLYRLGRTQIEMKQWPEATKSFSRLIEEFPEGSYLREAKFWKAEVAFQAGDVKAAESAFLALGKESPTPGEPATLVATIRRRRAQALIQLDRWADALTATDEFKAEFPKDPQLPELFYVRGRALQGLARFDEARTAYDEVISTRKGSELAARAQFMRGESYFHQKTYRDALKDFLKVDYLYDAPTWQAAALLEAGIVHEQLSQWTEAAETYERLRSKFPTDANAAKAQARLDAVRKRIAAVNGSMERAESRR